MTETPKYPNPDPEDEDLDDELDDLLDEELALDEGDRIPPHGDPMDDEE